MESLLIPSYILIAFIVIKTIKYKIDQHIDNKRYWRSVDEMMTRRNNEFHARLLNALEKELPNIIIKVQQFKAKQN